MADATMADAIERPLTPGEFDRLGRVSVRLPLSWTRSPRRRRCLFLGLAAPGFAAVFATPLHQSLWAMIVGVLLFTAAVMFRRRTERVFVRAEAAALWPPSPSSLEI